jgi:hypothetical protein
LPKRRRLNVRKQIADLLLQELCETTETDPKVEETDGDENRCTGTEEERKLVDEK